MVILHLDLVKRRRINNVALFIGLLALTFLWIFSSNYYYLSKIPLLDEIAKQIGIQNLSIFYILSYLFLFLITIPALKNLLKKKRLKGGYLKFTDELLKIKDRTWEYSIPLTDLEKMSIRLESEVALETTKDIPYILGNNWLSIPSKNGIYHCEFDLIDEAQKQQLLQVINELGQKFQIEIELIENK